MTPVNQLTWSERLAIIDQFAPGDDQICAAFQVTREELETARDISTTGNLLRPASDFDTSKYSTIFENVDIKSIPRIRQMPTTATRPAPRRRGRKGNNIANAFNHIPSSPTPASEFAAEHNVSIAVLRQSKRFDHTEKAPVHVAKDAGGTLMIWRGK